MFISAGKFPLHSVIYNIFWLMFPESRIFIFSNLESYFFGKSHVIFISIISNVCNEELRLYTNAKVRTIKVFKILCIHSTHLYLVENYVWIMFDRQSNCVFVYRSVRSRKISLSLSHIQYFLAYVSEVTYFYIFKS